MKNIIAVTLFFSVVSFSAYAVDGGAVVAAPSANWPQ